MWTASKRCSSRVWKLSYAFDARTLAMIEDDDDDDDDTHGFEIQLC